MQYVYQCFYYNAFLLDKRHYFDLRGFVSLYCGLLEGHFRKIEQYLNLLPLLLFILRSYMSYQAAAAMSFVKVREIRPEYTNIFPNQVDSSILTDIQIDYKINKRESSLSSIQAIVLHEDDVFPLQRSFHHSIQYIEDIQRRTQINFIFYIYKTAPGIKIMNTDFFKRFPL